MELFYGVSYTVSEAHLPEPLLFGIILIPVAISLFCKYALRFEISWLEFAAQLVIGFCVFSLIWAVGRYSAAGDTEILNGTVQSKNAWRFSCPTNTSNPCRNGYSCHSHQVCSTVGSGKDAHESCHEEHDTCYEYDWEQNWYVKSNVPTASEIEIKRVDAQGAYMPPRYDKVQVGDPVSGTHAYKNWVKASVNSLFKEDAGKDETYKALMKPYPIGIVDYYNIDRIVTPNFPLANKQAWNWELSKMLGKLGPSRQMNMVVVIANNVPRDYAYGVRRSWQGFKKNDAIIVIGLQNGKVSWGETMSWSKNSIFNIEMRNMVTDLQGTDINAVNPATFFANVQTISTKDFVRRPMKEFEYLKGDIPPPVWLIVLSVILAILFGVGTSVLFNNVDLDAAIFSGRRNQNWS
jgi:hypothetical protein